MADDAGTIEALYDRDVVAWAEQQAEALRRRLGGDALDYDNLADEIEDLAKSSRRACRSCIDRIVEHLLKLEFAPRYVRLECERGWRASVREHRYRLEDELTPTLSQRLSSEVQVRCARQANRLLDDGLLEDNEAVRARVRDGYNWDQITDQDWWPEPR